jgi:type I restriction enzyme S subunit
LSTERVRVGEIAEQIRGVSFSKADSRGKPAVGHIAVLTATNITERGISLDQLQYVPETRVSSRQMVRKGDVLVTASSGSLSVVGRGALVKSDLEASFGAFCKVLRPSGRVDPSYFGHFFRTADYRAKVSRLAAGANINNLRNEDLDGLEIPLPPLSEQRRIAEILDRADELRAKRRRALTILEELLEATFADMFDKQPRASVSRLSDLLVRPLRNGISPSSRGTFDAEVLTLSAITQGKFDATMSKSAKFDRPHDAVKTVFKGELLICRGNGNRNLVGRGELVTVSLPKVAFPDTMIAARFDERVVNPIYVQSVWHRPEVRRQIEAGARTTNGTFKVNHEVLESVEISIPPLRLQEKYASRAIAVGESVLSSLEHLAKLDELFASLQHRAFSGQL